MGKGTLIVNGKSQTRLFQNGLEIRNGTVKIMAVDNEIRGKYFVKYENTVIPVTHHSILQSELQQVTE